MRRTAVRFKGCEVIVGFVEQHAVRRGRQLDHVELPATGFALDAFLREAPGEGDELREALRADLEFGDDDVA